MITTMATSTVMTTTIITITIMRTATAMVAA